MKYVIALLLLFTLASKGFAQKADSLYLWKAVPGGSVVKQSAVYNYDSAKGIIRVTGVVSPLLKIYPVKNGTGAGIIVCPGGGYKFLAFDLEGEEIAAWLNSLGIAAFVLQYRVPDNQNGALQDAQRAVRLVRANAAKWGLDKTKIGLMGFSAGGNLTARASTGYKENSYVAVDNSDSVSCRPDFSMYIYPGSLATKPERKLIPEIKVDKATPPAFFFIANDDQYSLPLPFATALHDAGVPLEFHVVPKGGHGYGLRKGNPAAEVWPALAETWLKQTVHFEDKMRQVK
jgi:acetyl esterase/lipase